jgi:hypothetical protein
MKAFRKIAIVFTSIIIGIVGIWVIKTPIIASYLSAKLKTDVSMSGISISTKKVNMKNFRIKNPKGFDNRYAFMAKQLQIDYSLSSLFGKTKTIDNILIQDINLDIECTSALCSSNNWTQIINNIDSESKSKPSDKEYLIKTLTLKDLNVVISGSAFDFAINKNIKVDSITFNNISNKTGFPTSQLIQAIFQNAGLKEYIKDILEPQKWIEGAIDGLKDLGSSDYNSLEESLMSL